ncbi:unnamed protein product [Urochloa humidicola]
MPPLLRRRSSCADAAPLRPELLPSTAWIFLERRAGPVERLTEQFPHAGTPSVPFMTARPRPSPLRAEASTRSTAHCPFLAHISPWGGLLPPCGGSPQAAWGDDAPWMATGLRMGTPSLHDNSSPSVAAWSRALRPQAAPGPAQVRRAAGHEGTSTGADSATCLGSVTRCLRLRPPACGRGPWAPY